MVALMIVLALLFGFLFLRVKVEIGYADEVTLRLRILGIPIRILPSSKKKKKERGMSARKAQKIREKLQKKSDKKKIAKAEKKKAKEEKKKTKEKKSVQEIVGLIHMIIQLVEIVIGRFFRHLRIHIARIHVVIATGDAATTAIGYGAVTQAINVLFPILEQVRNFPKLKKADINVRADFEKESPELDILLGFSIRIWQVFHIAFGALFTFIKHMFKNKVKNESAHKAPSLPRATESGNKK